MKASSETTNSGARANRTGTKLEQFVFDTLLRCEYTQFENHKAQLFTNRHVVGGKQFQSQVNAGLTIYKNRRIVDFLVMNNKLFPDGLIIECKWQQASGSVDEKYPFLILNIMKTGVPTIVLLDGGGYKLAAKEWLENQVNPKRALIGVWDMAGFQKEVNDGFLG